MIPIVFCASFIPCPNENAAAETSWTFRNPLSRGSGRALLKIHVTARKKQNPRTGERTMKTSVLTRPVGTRTPGPAFTSAAPAKPPIRACDEDEGRDHH